MNRPGPITTSCSPEEGPDPRAFIVCAWLPPLKGTTRPMPFLDEEFKTAEDAQEAFQSTLREDGHHLFRIGWGAIYPPNRYGYQHIEWEVLLRDGDITKALEKIA